LRHFDRYRVKAAICDTLLKATVPTIRITDIATGRHAVHVPFYTRDLIIKVVSYACSAFSGFNIGIIPIVD
jgi:hypothetical protein